MVRIKLFEHQSVPYTYFGEARPERILTDLETLNEAAGAELFHLGHRQLSATQFVGVVHLSDLAIEVLPKIEAERAGAADDKPDSPDHSRAIHSATRNLLHLLSYTHDIRFKQEDLANLQSQQSSWLELLTAIFASNLHRLLQRGLVRNYVQVEESLPLVRGRWLVAQQLSRRPHVLHEFDLQFDEFSSDHDLNRVFRYAVETLLPITQSETNRTLLLDLLAWLDDVRRIPRPTSHLLDSIRFTRLNEAYRPSFNLARLFIENSISQLSAGRVKVFAFMFDMNRLFEAFVAGFLERHRGAILEGLTAPMLRPQSKGRTRHLVHRIPDRANRVRLKPDIVLEGHGGRPLLILDTKYKRLDLRQRDLGIAEGDLYQMLAYSTAYGCPKTLLVYPESKGKTLFSQHAFTNTDFINYAATINLHQDLSAPQGLIDRFGWLMRQTMDSSLT